MKNTIKVLGIIAIVAVIGFSVITCGGDGDNNDDNNNNNSNNGSNNGDDNGDGAGADWNWSSTADVYVAGYSKESFSGDTKATVWKNGVAQILSTQYSQAYSVYVSGSDVYVAGFVGKENNSRATLWKNGTAQTLASSSNSDGSFGKSVFVSGSNVYVAGNVGNNGGYSAGRRATLWTNGVYKYLNQVSDTNAADANSVFVSGSDVYVGGWSYTVGGATLWKNSAAGQNIQTSFENNINTWEINSLFVSGSDVYAAVGPAVSSGEAYLWKSGTAQKLTGITTATSVYVSGSDVYIAGLASQKPYFLKNGTAQALSTEASFQEPQIFVSGTDVYVTGQDNSKGAVLWKNGVAKYLDNPYSAAISVFVVSK